MAYIINKTTGEILITLPDGTADGPELNPGSNVADLDLFGKNFPFFGALQNQNFIKLLQNFASATAPTTPLQGELWYDTSTGLMKVYTGTTFIPVSPVIVSTSAPVTTVIGTQWWDLTNQQLNIWSGTSYVTVGPAYRAPDGKSGAIVENVLDTNSVSHTVVKFYTNNNVLAIASYDQPFTLKASYAVPGFSVISPGFTLAAEANNLFYGTATNSQQLGNIAAVNFARNDIDSSFFSNVIVGNGNLTLSTSTGTARFTNNVLNANVSVYNNISGVNTRTLSVNGATGEVTVSQNPTNALGVATKNYVDTNIGIAVAPLAPSYGPAFTGIPTAPNVALASTNTSQIATMASVQNAITNATTAPWLGSQKTVSNSTPTNGMGNPGDFWFQI